MNKVLENLNGFDCDEGITRLGGDDNFYVELIRDFHSEFRNSSQEFEKRLNEKDYETARRIVHTVKGVAGNLGIKKLHEAASQLESAVKKQNTADIDRLTVYFREVLSSVCRTIEESGITGKTVSEFGNREPDTEEASDLLNSFIEKCRIHQAKSAGEILKKLYEFRWDGYYRDQFENLKTAVKKYRLKEALISAEKVFEQLKGENNVRSVQ